MLKPKQQLPLQQLHQHQQLLLLQQLQMKQQRIIMEVLVIMEIILSNLVLTSLKSLARLRKSWMTTMKLNKVLELHRIT
jgi:hypothetical protein